MRVIGIFLLVATLVCVVAARADTLDNLLVSETDVTLESATLNTDHASIQPDARLRSVLWKIERPGIKISHLLGTIHIDDERVTRFSPALTNIISQSAAVVLEVQLDESAMAYMSQTMMFAAGDSLSNYLETEELKHIMRLLTGVDAINPVAIKLKPWAIMMQLSQPKMVGPPMDIKIQRIFEQAGKPVYQLETIAEQISIFDDLNVNIQIDLLRQTVAFHPRFKQLFDKLVNAYVAGDLQYLHDLNNQIVAEADSANLDRLMETLLEHRNKRMLERLQQHLLKGNRLIAVGALHLSGESGLVFSLKQQGYHLTPVKQNH